MLVRAINTGYYRERLQEAGSVFSFDMKHAKVEGKGKDKKPVLPTWMEEVKKTEVTKDEKDAVADAVDIQADAQKAYDSALGKSQKLESALQSAKGKEATEASTLSLQEANEELAAALAVLEDANEVLASL